MNRNARKLGQFLLALFLLSLLFTFSVGAATTESLSAPICDNITVMSYNVMDDCTANSNGVFPYASPAEREDAISEMLKAYQPDIIGMQEAGDGGASGILDWRSALDQDLKSIYAHRSLTDETGYKMDICRGLMIFYKKSRFTLLDSGAKGYSKPANNKRCYQWVKLRDELNGVEFYIFNTHWHVDGKTTLEENEAVRTVQMQELAKEVNRLVKDSHAILTGDFNSYYSPKNSMGDTVNITNLQVKTGYQDALMVTDEKYSINAAGSRTALQDGDSGLMTSADHVLFPPDFYTPVKLERILSRTYSPKLSDHDAFLVHFTYRMPTLTATAEAGNLSAYYSDGAYYIDNIKKRTTDLPIQVQLSKGKIFKDSACTQEAGTTLTIKCSASSTYMAQNTYYIQFGNEVYPLYLRSCNANALSGATLVDPSIAGKELGSTGLYCDKWYCRPVIVGETGFATIQEAVDAAKDGERVMVAPGTYQEDVTYSGKSLDFYGSNRNNIKALVLKDGQLTVNTGRTYETYLSGSITFSFGDLESGHIMVNGFHFIDCTATGQIRILGGNANKTVNLQISNNLFNCYTNGAINNGSAIHANTSLQKTGSITDNYFHLTQTPSYTNDSGATVNYTNRAMTMRNLKDMAITANYFDGYTGSKIRALWLSSEVSSGSTVAGYGNLALTANRFENSIPGSVSINNVRNDTNAHLLMAGNSYGGQKMAVDFRETANQEKQNLPTDKTKISFYVETAELPNLNILPASNSGISTEEFSHYVVFYNEAGTAIYAHSIIRNGTAVYQGATPTKVPTAGSHYIFDKWVDADDQTVDMNKLTTTQKVYAAFTASSHSLAVIGAKDAGCTEEGYSGDRICTVCGYQSAMGTILPATGHDYLYTNQDEHDHSATCRNCGDCLQEPHAFIEGLCICGAKTVIPDETINILHTLDLASDISVTFAVQQSSLANYDSYYLECVLPKYQGNAQVGTSTVQIRPVEKGSYYYFTLTGITAVQMNDMVDAVLHMTKGDKEYCSKTDRYSVATYAYKTLNESKDSKMLTLCADLLRYGAEAQSYKKYRTDALVDAGMTEIHRSYLSNTASLRFTATDSSLTDLQNPTITWVGKTLDLGSKVGIKFVFNAKNYSGDLSGLSMKVTYVNGQGETTIVTLTGAEVYSADKGYYSFTFYGLLASELRTAIDVAIYEGNTQLSETLRYSAETYASKTIDSTLEPLTRALFAYSDSAKAFFTK